MDVTGLAILAGFVIAYSLVSRRLESTPVTGPMVFVVAGIALGPPGLDVLNLGMDEGAVRVLAEATLVLLLFTDAIRIDLSRLRSQVDLPARLLGVGLPLTVIAGTAGALAILPGFGLWEAALVAAILSPTDAALGQAVVANRRVPVRIRQALNVESGLNDGIMLPVITLFLALAASGVDLETPSYWVRFTARQIGFGVLIAMVVGYAGGKLIEWFSARNWMDGAFRQLSALAVGVAAFAAAEAAGGTGFVAAFVAGLAFGEAARQHCPTVHDFAEDQGQLLSLLTFLFFGAALAGPALDQLTWRIALYAVLSLTVVRMVPVALGMIASGLRYRTVAFMAWFGPRGLASILFGLFILEEADLPASDDILLVVIWTVLASVFLHGLTAVPLSERYADWFEGRHGESIPEATEVEEMPLR